MSYRPATQFFAVVMNPPFTLMREFVDRALALGPRKVCSIGRLLWLEGDAINDSKREWFERTGLTRVWVFAKRVNIPPARYKDARADGTGGMVAFAWYVWERGHRGPWTGGFIGREEMGL